MEDLECEGRSLTSITETMIITEDRRITVHQLHVRLNISVRNVYSVPAEHVGLKRVCARYIPKLLILE